VSTDRITSERNLREQFNAIAAQLQGIEQLIADLRAARQRITTVAEQSDAQLGRFGAELDKAQHARLQLDQAIADQRRAIESVSDARVRLAAQLEIAEAASGKYARETAQVAAALSEQLQEQIDALRAEITSAAREEHVALDARQKEYVDATRTQLNDVLRAYQLANARQQEAERTLAGRLDAIEAALPGLRTNTDHALAAAAKSEAGVEAERRVRTRAVQETEYELTRSKRLIFLALVLAALGIVMAAVALLLKLSG
jgi:chromosome segregation ATPase